MAALMNQTRSDTAAFPRGMPIGSITDNQQVKRMATKHAATVQDAYAACHGVTVLTYAKQTMKHLIDAENKELEHSSLGTKPLDDSLPARPVSIVGLVTGPECKHQGAYAFLNAMAHFASSPASMSASHQDFSSLIAETEASAPTPAPPAMSTQTMLLSGHQSTCVAQHARVTFLVGADACDYILSRSASIESMADSRQYLKEPCCLVVAVSYALKEGPVTTLHTKIVPLAMPAANTADAYYDALIATLAKVSDKFEVLLPGVVFATRDSCSNTAFVDAAKRISDSFMDLIRPEVSVKLTKYSHSTQCQNPLAFSGIYVRIMPQQDCGGLTSPKCSHGVLVHERDRDEDVREYIRSVATEERGRGANVFGLRPPSPTISEESLNLHVIDVHAEGFSMGKLVTLYGLAGVPGMRLSVNDGSQAWRLNRRLHRLDGEFAKQFYVLPCTKKACEPEQSSLRLASFELLEDTIAEVADCFENTNLRGFPEKTGGSDLTRVLSFDPFSLERPDDTPPGPIDPEIAFLNSAIGLGFNCPACRVGDVYDEAKRRNAPGSICSLLVSAIARSGPDASVTVALEAIGKQLTVFENQATILQKEVEKVTEELRVHKSAAESHRHPADARPSVSVPQSTSSVPLQGGGQLSPTGVQRLASSLNMKSATQGITIAEDADFPIEKVLTILAKSYGCKKADLPVLGIQQARQVAADTHGMQLIQRVVQCTRPIAAAVSTPLFLLTPCESHVCSVDLRSGHEVSGVTILNETETPGFVVLRENFLTFYHKM